jgi:multisubunit Na+/H+ antiporter MnhC subunit
LGLVATRARGIGRRLSWHQILLGGLILAGAGLRLSLIDGGRFHVDEAIYGYWAQLVASGRDPLLLSVPLDKPPLFIYLLAALFRLFGPTEIAARLIGEAASLAAVGLTHRLARRLYGRPVALLAAAAMALSPFNLLFAPTAFTDPLMVALVLTAMILATEGHWAWAGALAGLAVAAKQQGLLFLPLIAATGWIAAHRRDRTGGLAQLGLGFAGVMLILTGWDALRWSVRASFWEQSAASHGALHLVIAPQLGQRLADWSTLLGYVLDAPLLNAALLLGVPLLLWRGRQRLRAAGMAALPARADWLLAGFSALFVLTHYLLSFSAWDRYLLGIVPPACLLLARVVWCGSSRLGLKGTGLALLILVLLMAGPAVRAAGGAYPVGGNRDAYEGLEEIVAFFRQVPAGSVVWHRYLGWHYFHYLFDAPLDLRWYADPATLAAKAAQETGPPGYVAFPAWESAAEPEVRAALRAAGRHLALERCVWREDGRLAFSIYRITTRDAAQGETRCSTER